MMNWADHEAMMNGKVDDLLGDVIAWSSANGPFVEVKGFVLFEVAPVGIGEIDEMLHRPHIKIAKSRVPSLSSADRIRNARLGDGTWRPTPNRQPDSTGNYWLIDIQRASN